MLILFKFILIMSWLNFGQDLLSGGISSGLSSIFSGIRAKKQLKYQQQLNNQVFEQNKQLASLQNQYNIDQWNRENEYNTPLAQMQRYKAAGLNPDLIYGQQNLSASSPQLVGGTPNTAPDVSSVYSNSVNQMAALSQVFNQNALLKSQIELTNAQSSKLKSEGKLIDSTSDSNIALASKMVEQLDAQITQIRESSDLTSAQKRKTIAETNKLKLEIENYDVVVDSIIAQTEQMQASTESVEVDTFIKSEMWQTEKKKLVAEIVNLAKQGKLLDKQFENYDYTNKHIDAQCRLLLSQTTSEDERRRLLLPFELKSAVHNANIAATSDKLHEDLLLMQINTGYVNTVGNSFTKFLEIGKRGGIKR